MTASPAAVSFTIPGEPCAQGRPRFSTFRGRPRAVDPPKAREWKARAAQLMALYRPKPHWVPTFPSGPLEVRVLAVFECPKGERRVRTPAPRRAHTSTPDAENVAKAVLDAATRAGVWRDDAQVARLHVDKVVGAQDEEPYVLLEVRPLAPESEVMARS